MIDIDKSWYDIKSPENVNLKFRYLQYEDIPKGLHGFMRETQLIEFKAEPEIDFFKGFFTVFTLERKDGIFVQKVMYNKIDSVVDALPLYFFNYSTFESNELGDFKDYYLDSKGNNDNLIINAYGENGEITIKVSDVKS